MIIRIYVIIDISDMLLKLHLYSYTAIYTHYIIRPLHIRNKKTLIKIIYKWCIFLNSSNIYNSIGNC